MKKTILLTVFALVLFPQLSFICYGTDSKNRIVDNIYSSVVVITHTEMKSSVSHVLYSIIGIASRVAVGYGWISIPGYSEKTGGTGFQTEWGVVTNSHVMEDKPKASLTTFHNKHYSIKEINKTNCKKQTINTTTLNVVSPISERPVGKPTPKHSYGKKPHFDNAIVYDWGDLNIDLALICVKIPDAVELPLAQEVIIGEKVITLGHPNWKEFTPAVGSVRNIFSRKGVKLVQLQIEHAPGCSGSPVVNMRGEVIGVIWGGPRDQDVAEAVHVDELRKAFGLPVYASHKRQYTPDKASTSDKAGVLAGDVVSEDMRQDLALEPDDRILNMTCADFAVAVDTVEEFWSAWGNLDKTKTCKFLIIRGGKFYDVKFVPSPLHVIQKAPQVDKPWIGPVYSTQYSRLYHRPDCDELLTGSGDLIEFTSMVRAVHDGGTACQTCNP